MRKSSTSVTVDSSSSIPSLNLDLEIVMVFYTEPVI